MTYADDVAAARAALSAAQNAFNAASSAYSAAKLAADDALATLIACESNLSAAQDALKRLLDNPPPPPVTTKAKLGMSAPVATWNTRVAEVGPGLQARRIFLTSLGEFPLRINEAVNAKQMPVISLKVPSWSAMGAGTYDSQVRSLGTKLKALNHPVGVAFHHEPAKSGHPPVGEAGTPAQWAQMQRRCLPLLESVVGANLMTMLIGNGWWWNSNSQRYSDAELEQWIPDDVRQMVDVVAADTYQMAPGDEEPAPKMANMVAWAKRMGDVKGLGVGEFNSHTAKGITDACALLKSEPLFKVGCLWNTDEGTKVSHLTGDRLTAFRTALAAW